MVPSEFVITRIHCIINKLTGFLAIELYFLTQIHYIVLFTCRSFGTLIRGNLHGGFTKRIEMRNNRVTHYIFCGTSAGVLKNRMVFISFTVMWFKNTILDKIYLNNYEKRYCFGSHKHLKTILRDHMVKLKMT